MIDSPTSPPADVRSFCLRVLERGDLASKLSAPRDESGAMLPDDRPGPAVLIDAPGRGSSLQMRGGTGKLPRPPALVDSAARALCLARFAHHELMAAELFAWALLRWPEMPGDLRRTLLRILEEEQLHCRLYLERLAAHGRTMADYEHSGYFWQHARAIASSPAGPRAFLAAMGLTLEQANLDFAPLYAEGFAAAGDRESAEVCRLVHRDEIGHVRAAARWLRILDVDHGDDQIAAYEAAVPFPLAASRAKGRRFDAESRRVAGLSDHFIEYVRAARSSQQTGRVPKGPTG